MVRPGISRRQFLQGATASSGLLMLGVSLQSRAERQLQANDAKPFSPNASIRIARDNSTEIIIGHAEMGQNVITGLPMIIAEELDADWRNISVKFGPVDPAYFNPKFGMMGTGGSTSTYSNYERLRIAGATARAMLVTAAAQHWGVDHSTLSTRDSRVFNPANGDSVSYGELSGLASKVALPSEAPLKHSSQFRLIGRDVNRLDSAAKVTGQSRFGIDAQLPDLHYAALAHPPVFGASVISVDSKAALAMPGVVKVKLIDHGVAVIADSYWRAKTARDALNISWDEGEWAGTQSADLDRQYRELVATTGVTVSNHGDTKRAFEQADKVVEGIYELPFLAHACMEPLNCTVHDHGGSADIYVGTQLQSLDQKNAAKILGYPAGQVNIHSQMLGGGFGRRACKSSDFVCAATMIARGEAWPVKMLWTREDDINSGYFRPKYTHRGRMALDADGNIDGWEQRVVGQRLDVGGMFSPELAPFDPALVEGLSHFPYAVDNLRVEAHSLVTPVTTLWWRSVGHSHTAFVMESMVDEAAHIASADPVDYRRQLYRNHPRMQALLNKTASMSGWGRSLPPGTGLGVAVHDSYAFKGICAQVAQVRVSGTGFTVEKVWCGIDCGFAVNPNGVRAQMESAIIFGLNGLLGEITFNNGRVVENNYDKYRVARIDQAPQIEVAIINSGAEMGGIGEPGLPPIAPAVTNAIFAASGRRIRKLPVKL